MVKSYFDLYQRAFKLYSEGKVKIDYVRENKDSTIYIFKANGHVVTLKNSKMENGHLWQRNWSCDCHHFSLWQDKTECKHIKACELFLMNGGYK